MYDRISLYKHINFEFLKEPKIFYFSKEDREDISLTKLSHQLFPCNINELFPDIITTDTIYTLFDKELEGFQPLGCFFFIRKLLSGQTLL